MTTLQNNTLHSKTPEHLLAFALELNLLGATLNGDMNDE
jgi:hypothetical protein